MKDIAKDFNIWINSQIPGLSQASRDPYVKQQLDPLMKNIIANKDNPAVVNKLVKKYATVALAGVDYVNDKISGKISNTPVQSTVAQRNAAYATGLDDRTVAKLKQQIQQSKEKVNVRSTGSPTIDNLMKAVGLVAENNTNYVPQEDYYETKRRLAESSRRRQIENHNIMVNKTMADLRNAEIFNTAQAHYLQQQLAQLMATKY